MTAAMYVLAHWQLAGRSLTRLVPSALLVSAGAELDEIDCLVKEWSVDIGCKIDPSASGTRLPFFGNFEEARETMLLMIHKLQELRSPNEAAIESFRSRFQAAKELRFGYGRIGYYSKVWDEDLGWMTDTTHDLVLRLDHPEDHSGFRKDVFETPGKLLIPLGAGEARKNLCKTLSVTGSLQPAQWDSQLTEGILRLGLPTVFLPHLAKDLRKEGTDFEMIIRTLQFVNRRAKFMPVFPAVSISKEYPFGVYEQLLRKRLRNLPAAYEYSMLTLAHELSVVCALIVENMTPLGCRLDAQSALWTDLYAMAFRGIVIGTYSLAYHGHGLDTDRPHKEVLKLLTHLRSHGPMSLRDFLRKFQTFDAASRDRLLELLVAEGVIRIDAKQISAVPLAEFVQELHDRDMFVEPPFLCPVILKM
jgi:hypothetical protein